MNLKMKDIMTLIMGTLCLLCGVLAGSTFLALLGVALFGVELYKYNQEHHNASNDTSGTDSSGMSDSGHVSHS